jgi:general secretion pathway protein H
MRIFTANNIIRRVLKKNKVWNRSIQNGFTLVELMIVIFLIGLASAAVVLSLPGEKSILRQDADKLAARIAAARDQAVLESKPMAIWFRPSGYGFEQRSKGQWQAANGKSFTQNEWSKGTKLGLKEQASARLIFDATGLPSAPLDLTLRNNDATLQIVVSASGDVKIAA